MSEHTYHPRMCLRYIHIPKGYTTQTASFKTWNETLIRVPGLFRSHVREVSKLQQVPQSNTVLG